MSKNERWWPAATLTSRGWSEELMRELLPKPAYRYFGGKRRRCWDRDAVRAAEENERFRAEAKAVREKQQQAHVDAQQALADARELLMRAWSTQINSLEPAARQTRPLKLALHCHEAILHRLAAVEWADRMRPGQAMSYIREFLALEKAAPAEKVPGILKRFVTALPWLGRNAAAPLAQELEHRYGAVLTAAAEQLLAAFLEAEPSAAVDGLLDMERFPAEELLAHTLGYIYSVLYVPRAIRTSLEMLAVLNPKDEYPEARAMQRHFILHIGGTNTGKTYAGFQRLMEAATGVYLAPLRLLALEAQEVLLDGGVACSLTTGEEEDREPDDTHVAATAEKLDLTVRYDVAVIDECQMISDPQRGWAWTRAILGVQAPEVHLCAAPQAKALLLRIIRSCGDSWEVVEHRRKVPLVCMKRTIDYTDVQPGDALITFSKVGVLSVAEDLRRRGKEPAIIYGALPYATRRKQMEGFLRGEMQYVVSTDAIGMGLNLPIRRIIFMDTEKFDGVERRSLRPEEIQQIAGRAGRFGMYDRGFVGATQELGLIAAGLETVVPPLEYAVLGFSDMVLNVEFDLLEVLEVWNRIPTAAPYVKLDVSRYITIISRLRQAGFALTKEQELRAGNIPFDETEEALQSQFLHLLRCYRNGEAIERPALPEKPAEQFTLPELELYYRQLDLYFSFSKAFGCPVDQDWLHDVRTQVADQINQILLHNLRNNIRFCARCGAALPLHHSGRLCARCYNRTHSGYRPPRRR